MRASGFLGASSHEWSDEDVAAWKSACDVHGVDPVLLLKCAAHESGCNPSAVNHYTDKEGTVHYGAAGLIQIEPANFSPLGFHGDSQQFAALSVAEQCRYVDRYLGWFPAMRGKGLAGVYAGLFLPALITVADQHTDEPLCGEHGPFAEFYEPNICFDVPGPDGKRKGYIDGKDLIYAAEKAFASCPMAMRIAVKIAGEVHIVVPVEPPFDGAMTLNVPGLTEPSEPEDAA